MQKARQWVLSAIYLLFKTFFIIFSNFKIKMRIFAHLPTDILIQSDIPQRKKK